MLYKVASSCASIRKEVETALARQPFWNSKRQYVLSLTSDSTGIGFFSPFAPLFNNLGEKLAFPKGGLFQIHINENLEWSGNQIWTPGFRSSPLLHPMLRVWVPQTINYQIFLLTVQQCFRYGLLFSRNFGQNVKKNSNFSSIKK